MATRKDYDAAQQLMKKQPPKSFFSSLASLFFFNKRKDGPRDDSKISTPRSNQTYFGAFLSFATSWLQIFSSKPKSPPPQTDHNNTKSLTNPPSVPVAVLVGV